MKRFFIILSACLTTTLLAWAAWPKGNASETRESNGRQITTCENLSSKASNLTIYKDDCGKCKIYLANNKEPKNICGKCGEVMTDSYDGVTKKEKDGIYAYYTYTCKNKNCKHECYGKMRQ